MPTNDGNPKANQPDSPTGIRIVVKSKVPSLNALLAMGFRARYRMRQDIAKDFLSSFEASGPDFVTQITLWANTISTASGTPDCSPMTRLNSWITASSSRNVRKKKKEPKSQ